MADKIMRAVALIEAHDKTGKAFSSAAANARNLELRLRAVGKTGAAGTGAFARMEAGAMALGRGLAGAAAGYLALRQARESYLRSAEVERRMGRIGITGDAGVAETRKGMESLREISKETALGFNDVAGGMESIVASGRSFGDALAMMPSVAKTAQASGASVADIANSSTALLDHMKISIQGLQAAQDAMAKGGELGKFELKDMARYLPSMLPAVKALGIEGQAGLEKLVAMLQVIRAGTGTAEEAASSASNIFAKMESEETTKRFEKFGVNLRKEMEKARKEGKDLLTTFVELSDKALKGDLSKLPQLFSDMEFARGMRALLSQWPKVAELQAQIARGAGTIDANLKRILADSQTGIDRMSESADRLKTAFGDLLKVAFDEPIRNAAQALDDFAKKLEHLKAEIEGKGTGKALEDNILAPLLGEEGQKQRAQARASADRKRERAAAEAEIAAANRERAEVQAGLEKARAAAQRQPGNAFWRAQVQHHEGRLKEIDARVGAATAKAMPPLPPDVPAPWISVPWRHPDAEDRRDPPDWTPGRGDKPLPPRRPGQSAINEMVGGVSVPPAGLEAATAAVAGAIAAGADQAKAALLAAEWTRGNDRLLEDARRAADEFRRDPEAARGRAMGKLSEGEIVATVKPDQIMAKAEVKGEATVNHTFTLNFNAGAFQQFLDGRIAAQVSKIRLHSNGAGSTGVSSPDAQ